MPHHFHKIATKINAMSKKITSALLVATALLLSLPTLAQVAAKKQADQSPKFKVMELQQGKPTASQARAVFQQQQAKQGKKALAEARKKELTIQRSQNPTSRPQSLLTPAGNTDKGDWWGSGNAGWSTPACGPRQGLSYPA